MKALQNDSPKNDAIDRTIKILIGQKASYVLDCHNQQEKIDSQQFISDLREDLDSQITGTKGIGFAIKESQNGLAPATTKKKDIEEFSGNLIKNADSRSLKNMLNLIGLIKGNIEKEMVKRSQFEKIS